MTEPSNGTSEADFLTKLRRRLESVDQEGKNVVKQFGGSNAVSEEIFGLLFNRYEGVISSQAPWPEQEHWIPLSGVHEQMEGVAQCASDYIAAATVSATDSEKTQTVQTVRRIYADELASLARRWLPESGDFDPRDEQKRQARRAILNSHDLWSSQGRGESSQTNATGVSEPDSEHSDTAGRDMDLSRPRRAETPSLAHPVTSAGPTTIFTNPRSINHSTATTTAQRDPLSTASNVSPSRYSSISEETLATLSKIVQDFARKQGEQSQAGSPHRGSSVPTWQSHTTSSLSLDNSVLSPIHYLARLRSLSLASLCHC